MKKFTLMMSIVFALLTSLNNYAQTVLFSEDFEDQNAASRFTVAEEGTSNVFDLATDYSTTPVSPVANGGTYCTKIAVNTVNGESSTVGLYPNGESFTPPYTLSFDAWMNHNATGSTTEFIFFGIGHMVPIVFPLDGYDVAISADCGSSRDIRLYQDGAEILFDDCIPCYPGGSNLDPDGNPYGQNTGGAYAIFETYYGESLPAGSVDTGNQWIAYTVEVTETDATFKINGVAWAHADAAPAGNVLVGYRDAFTSVSNEESYILIDNIKVIDGVLGTADNRIDGFSMYPNPANNILNISADQDIDVISIYNVLGQKVLVASPSQSQVDISDLNAGSYFVKVQAGNQVGTYNLIKQ